MSKLTPRQHAFVEEYLLDYNASAAALRAGLHRDSGRRLLRDPRVSAALALANKDVAARHQADRTEFITALKALAYADLTPYIAWFATDATWEGLAALPAPVQRCLDLRVRDTATGPRRTVQLTPQRHLLRLLAQLLGLTTTPYLPLEAAHTEQIATQPRQRTPTPPPSLIPVDATTPVWKDLSAEASAKADVSEASPAAPILAPCDQTPDTADISRHPAPVREGGQVADRLSSGYFSAPMTSQNSLSPSPPPPPRSGEGAGGRGPAEEPATPTDRPDTRETNQPDISRQRV